MLRVQTKMIMSKFLVVLLILMAVSFWLPVYASAVESEDEYIELDGTFTGRFELSSNKMHLFQLKDIVPGDQWSGTIHVKNSCYDKMEFSIVSVISNLEDVLLFDALVTEIRVDDEVIYNGTYGYQDDKTFMTAFYPIEPGKSLDFDITVTLPPTVGNEMMGKTMESTWTFEARYYYNPPPVKEYDYVVRYVDKEGNALIDSKTGQALLDETVTETAPSIAGYIPDEDTKSIVIRDGDNEIVFVYDQVPVPPTPKSDDIPKTGYDSIKSNPIVWIASAVLTLACVTLIGFYISFVMQKEMEKKPGNHAETDQSSEQ